METVSIDLENCYGIKKLELFLFSGNSHQHRPPKFAHLRWTSEFQRGTIRHV